MGRPHTTVDVMTVTATQALESLEQRSASAFMLTGVLILVSLIVPIGLEARTDWSWVSGLALIGLAVVTVSVGLLGLYPQVNDRTPRLALAGAGAATVAGAAALGLIALVGVALGSEIVDGFTVSEPMRVFALLGLSMAGGFSLGLLLFGVATWQTEIPSRTVGILLIAGGVALLAPVVVEFLGLAFGVNTPLWLLFPVIGGVALDTVVIGYSLRTRATTTE